MPKFVVSLSWFGGGGGGGSPREMPKFEISTSVGASSGYAPVHTIHHARQCLPDIIHVTRFGASEHQHVVNCVLLGMRYKAHYNQAESHR